MTPNDRPTAPPTSALSDHAQLGHRLAATDASALRALLALWRALTMPHFEGLENIPSDGPVLLVGNHTLFGMLDLPLMVEEIHRHHGRLVRGLAEHAHYAIPGWRSVLTRAGAVRGTRENCRTLLDGGEAVLVFPGGGREVAKRKGEKYQLIWKQRTGFARMAIEAGCPIVPFASVGAEESYDILIDADSPLLAPLRGVVERAGGRWEIVPPLARGVGITGFPRPQRFYFAFGEPIETTRWNRQAEDHALRSVRDQTKHAVETKIEHLLAFREEDPARELSGRALKALRRGR